MTHAHRSSLHHQSTRDIYSPATPTYGRDQRSPSFPGHAHLRRIPLSPTPSPSMNFAHPIRMDTSYSNNGAGSSSKGPQNCIPPMNALTMLGTVSYADPTGHPVSVEISGTIDKGFFLAENDEWTCYRRNYFSCICSYSLSPPTNLAAQPLQFLPKGATQPFTIYGFAMSISAVVAENDSHAIDLVQHTPKRDKGPIAKPEKVRLLPKVSTHHPLSYGGQDPSARSYDQGYGQGQSQHPVEHTFERIQFKQATANNGKRRAAQQYYHLVVELWADVGSQHSDQFVKVAYRKSAKMIVRGRSPGHYQVERRASASSGPGGSGGGSIAGGYPSSVMGGHDYGQGGSLLSHPYSSPYDSRSSGAYGGARHHHEMNLMEPMIPHEDAKSISDPKGYQYFPSTLYEGSEPDSKHRVELFHAHGEPESLPHMQTRVDIGSRIKPEAELPSMFYGGNSFLGRGCGQYESKTSSAGYYPTMLPPSSTLNMSN